MAQSVDLTIQHANIVDVKNGRIIKDQTIQIKDQRIVAITSNASKSIQSRDTWNARGKYIMPGLWDNHIHFGGGDTLIEENKALLDLFLINGVTSIRDCAADISPSVLAWKKEVQQNTLRGPSIYTSGPKIEGYKSIWVGDLEVDNSQELDQAFDSLTHLKVDFIKVTDNTLKPSLYLEAIRKARAKGWNVSAHIPAVLTLKEVSEAGLSTIEHLGYLLRAGSAKEAEYTEAIAKGQMTPKAYNQLLMQHFDTAAALNTYRLLAKNGTAVVPTLNISRSVAFLDQEKHDNDPELKMIGPGLVRTYQWRVDRAAKDDAAAIAYRHELFEKTAGLLPLLHQAGVKIIAGTDAGYLNSFDYPGSGLHKELQLMVRYGLTAREALEASVLAGPQLMQVEKDYGSVSVGKIADLLLLNENPLEDIRATQKIHAVVLKGKGFDQTSLQEIQQKLMH